MSVNQRTLNNVVLAYIEAWSTPDEAVRRDLLDASLADDASYTDPAYEVRGKEEIASHIGRSLSGRPTGGRSWGPDPDQQRGRPAPRVDSLLWVMVDPQDQLLLEGMDFVELAGDGRLQRITGFFGAFPPIPESWPEDLVWRSE